MAELSPVAQRLRQGLRRLAKAVVVITCQHEGQRFAMAATAVSELSMEPPSLLICVNRTASLYTPLSQGADFCVNILHSDHGEISALCSGKVRGEARFETGNWGSTAEGCPVLLDAQASFFCRHEKAMDYGTHHIVIGRVEDVLIDGELSPLVYADGRYLRLGEPIEPG